MIREGIEDYVRYKSDQSKYFSFLTCLETNSQMVKALRDGDFMEIQSWQLQVGDIVFVKEDELFPCDMLLLASSANGDAYIQTSSLDGEKNLKKR